MVILFLIHWYSYFSEWSFRFVCSYENIIIFKLMTYFRMKALLLFFCAGLVALTSAKVYKATVKGTTICQSKRYTGVVVILMEKDRREFSALESQQYDCMDGTIFF